MLVTLKDLRTGETAVDPNSWTFWCWTEGNASCDCNRILAFPKIDESAYVKELGLVENQCLGNRRFIVIGATGDLEGHAEEELIRLANEFYPTEFKID